MVYLKCLFVAAACLLSPRICRAFATESFGPARDFGHPLVAQPGWPDGMVELLSHDTRIYSYWINGHEEVFFKPQPEQIGELIELFSKLHLRDHLVIIRHRNEDRLGLHGKPVPSNVTLSFPGGIVLGSRRREHIEPDTYEPRLTLWVDPQADREWLSQLTLPANVAIETKLDDLPLAAKTQMPERQLWYVRVVLSDQTPSTNFERGYVTDVTLWREESLIGIDLGHVQIEGDFCTPLSEQEVQDLKTGKLWMTLNMRNSRSTERPPAPNPQATRLSSEDLSTDPAAIKVVEIERTTPLPDASGLD